MGGFLRAAGASVAAALDDGGPVPFDRLEAPTPRLTETAGSSCLSVPAASLTALAREAFSRLAFRLRRGYVEALATVAADPRALPNDRWLAATLLENARVAAAGEFPLCQDTGTAAVFCWKGGRVLVDHGDALGDDADALAAGARSAWTGKLLRNSQISPLPGGGEANTGDNLPLAAELYAAPGRAMHFLFMAKGGGSSNKTALFQETKRILEPARMEAFIREKVASLGVSACPPYRIAFAFGGQSPEECVLAARLASAGALDAFPVVDGGATGGPPSGAAFRDAGIERLVMEAAADSGWGAQFGGSFMAWSARAVRLARHAASFPVALAVSCAAHRQLYARIDDDGVWLERLAGADELEALISRARAGTMRPAGLPPAPVDLSRGPEAWRDLRAGRFVELSGPVVLARDAAHARLSALIARGEELPSWTRYPVYYAGPTGTPPGRAVGSLGPTTSRRMDSYLKELMSRGVFLAMLGKGERGPSCREACAAYGGVYFAVPGGAAALAASRHVRSARTLDWEDLGMEAVRLVELEGLPAMVAVDSTGADFYEGLRRA